MKAILVEGVAGSGKTTYIANDAKEHWIPGLMLMLTFSRTGKEVLKLYLEQRQVKNAAVYTIDGFACHLLQQLGDTRFILNRSTIQKDLLPSLYEQVSEQLFNYAQATHQFIDLPSPSPMLMQELMDDIDFYRASCAFDYDDDDALEEILAGKLNHDWRLVRRMFAAYDTYRETWHPALSSYDNSIFEWEDEQQPKTMPYGEQGFRSLGEAVYDLLNYVEDSDILERMGQKFPQQFIDEFHDTTPLQLRFLLRLAKSAQYVVAVGDRFQNIFAWRGTNTDIVFDQFIRELGAEQRYLNHSYRYGKKIADLAQNIIHRPITPLAPHNSYIEKVDQQGFTHIHRETVVISQDAPAQIHAAFALFTHSKNKMAINIHHSIGVAILNILCIIRYDYLLDPKSKVVKNIGLDLNQFLQLPQCLLPDVAKQEMLKKPTPQTIRMYFDVHLSGPIHQHPSTDTTQPLAYQRDFYETLLIWRDQQNQEHESVYEIMCWFEKSARLWSSSSQRVYDRINRAAWDALKEDALIHGYRLAQWHERANLLHRRYNDKEGVRFVTVSQAKGREYDSVLVYGADETGFHQTQNELAQHQFYVAITRARKQLALYLPANNLFQDNAMPVVHHSTVPHFQDDDLSSLSSHKTHQPLQYMSTKKRQALSELRHIKEQLKKRQAQKVSSTN